MTSQIISYCRIKNDGVILNDRPLPYDTSSLKQWYQGLSIHYPKFHKMDRYSQLVFLGVEELWTQIRPAIDFEASISMIFANSNSCIHTDMGFYKTLEKNRPSPSLFVYTLPNIMMGELSIRHQWKGEQFFFILPKFDAIFYYNYTNLQFEIGKKFALVGWVEQTGQQLDLLLYFISNSSVTGPISIAHTIEELNKLYTI